MPSLINKAQVRQFILDRVRDLRPAWSCNRVSAEVLERIEADLRQRLLQMIRAHPTLGRTFRP